MAPQNISRVIFSDLPRTENLTFNRVEANTPPPQLKMQLCSLPSSGSCSLRAEVQCHVAFE